MGSKLLLPRMLEMFDDMIQRRERKIGVPLGIDRDGRGGGGGGYRTGGR